MGIGAKKSGKRQRSVLDVTPLVDVVLVLLVIFMVTMPVALRSIEAELPSDGAPINTNLEALHIHVEGHVDGTIALGVAPDEAKSVSRVQLAGTIRAQLTATPHDIATVEVDFEDGLSWSESVSILDTIRGASKGHAQAVHIALASR